MVATGVYEVQESGLQWKHNIQQQRENEPGTPQEFLDNFSQNFEMRVLERPSEDHLILEFNHVDVSFVNALRRILLSEIPTVAIEMVYMWINTGIIHDEVLCHRLGLIPIYFDPRRLQSMEETDGTAEAGAPTDRNTIVFRLNIKCTAEDAQEDKKKHQKSAAADDDSDDEGVVPKSAHPALEEATTAAARAKAKENSKKIPKRPYTKHVYSGDMEWVPQGDQAKRLEDTDVRVVHDDILICKLRPGQEIELEAHARKGTGKDHAKFSPVATASYRLCTEITLLEPVYDELAEELVHLYEPGVFELVPSDEPGTRVEAKVCNPYACTMSRNYMRNPQLAKAIKMVRIPDRFIFSIESVGHYKPAVLLGQALNILQGKCRRVQDLADQAMGR
ncbi:I and III subunit RPAC1 [Seminavis robusta]|uniref:I and III subunit RPAC1 n=1 Tax=Seminavis robusta TaxID=568900 RepID=A0A9N8HM13_9STRA|nr:I and III subunit RPAC1 [Seminavis robusta]|eukprot:Sro714_g191720.1 I and III subunit RPAC1 (391) ;mRNA; r:28588-29866